MTATLHRVVSGPPAAPVLLLGSSLGTTSTMWDPQIATLAGRFRVVRFDHRGHGGSASPAGEWSIADLGRDVLALLDDLSVARVCYAGLSLGGMVGMWLAAHVPDRIERLAVFCTSAYLDAAEYWQGRAATVRAGGMAAIVDRVVQGWFTPAFAREYPAVLADFKQMLASNDPSGYAACCEAIGAMDLRAELPAIEAPTLVVSAEDDLAIPVRHGEAIAAAIPGARFSVVRRAAHLASVEQPEAITRAIVDHMTGAEV